MKLHDLLERQNYDPKHVCQTPGAIYSTKLHDNVVTLSIELPEGVKLPDDKTGSQELEVDLHYAVERVLRRLFQ